MTLLKMQCFKFSGKNQKESYARLMANNLHRGRECNLKDFFNFILTGKGETELSKKLEDEVEKARMHEEWRIEYMTLFMRDEEKRAEGESQGIAKGIAKGKRDAIQKLIKNGQSELLGN